MGQIMRICQTHGVEKSAHNSGQRIKWRCLECENIRLKKYRSGGSRAWDKRNPEKRRAHKLVEAALLRGALEKQSCQRCGAGKAQAHHDDYSKPLDVMWLCPPCHGQRHRELRRAA